MNLYQRLLRPLFFRFDPESVHEFTVRNLSRAVSLPPVGALLEKSFSFRSPRLRVNVGGIEFQNPVGMAAGFDKNARAYPFLARMGFGFVESGTFTALKQEGNPRPRLFRFPGEQALVNRMGFNNPGAEDVARILAGRTRTIPLGINIGKSKLAELDRAGADYAASLRLLSSFGDYIAVNVSSPNTPDLRRLQEKGRLSELLGEIQKQLREFAGPADPAAPSSPDTMPVPKPLFLKIAPDLDEGQLEDIIAVVLERKLAGIILSNTTLDKSALSPAGEAPEGGLSGAPLRSRSTEMIRTVYARTEGRLPIIGVGGIFSGPDALEKILAGASLVQIYTGYIYEGPGLPARINRFLADFCEKQGATLPDLIGREKRI